MKRLTKDNYSDDCFRIQNELNQLPEYKSNHYSQSQYNADLWNKVKAIEDIEEELGIDLITLYKALKDGIYCKIENKIEHILAPYLTWHCKKIYICDICNLNDYGKTWALTKEDLENEK